MIEFPCDFPLKIVFDNLPGVEDSLLDIIRHFYPELSIDAIKRQPSKNGNYIAMTAVIRAMDQSTLDSVYRKLTQHCHTKMVL
jgi:putative lipoic acid-binding regulatory protein